MDDDDGSGEGSDNASSGGGARAAPMRLLDAWLGGGGGSFASKLRSWKLEERSMTSFFMWHLEILKKNFHVVQGIS